MKENNIAKVYFRSALLLVEGLYNVYIFEENNASTDIRNIALLEVVVKQVITGIKTILQNF